MEDATNAKRLENNPNDIMEKDIDIVKCLQCWIVRMMTFKEGGIQMT